jgi:hypothetical protein
MIMKLSILVLTLVVVGACLLSDSVAATETNAVDFSSELLKGDAQRVATILPQIEALWPAQPQEFFHSARLAARTLGGAASDQHVREALFDLFSRMMEHPCPTNGMVAVACLEDKRAAINSSLNSKELREARSTWLGIAKFIGEIRSQIIPGFVRKPVYSNNNLGLSPEQIRQAIEENKRNMAINKLQQTLEETNETLTFFLLHQAHGAVGKTGLIDQIVSLAHLKPDEVRQLE